MKIIELIESQDEIKNPLGTPASSVQRFIENLKIIEDQFAKGLFGQNLTGEQYVSSLREIDSLGHEIKLPIKQLITTENKLSKSHLNALIVGDAVKTSGNLPKVYLYKSKYYLTDGNHRVAAKLLQGDKTVDVLLIDVERLTKFVNQLTNH